MTTIITSFDGDPFLLNFWLKLYEKYWRGEVDQVCLSIFYNKDVIPDAVMAYNKKLLDRFKEIALFLQPSWLPPEKTNEIMLAQAKGDKIGLIESDGFIFGKGIIKKCFDDLNNYDIVAPKWDLINYPYIRGDMGVMGFMRCFFFTTRKMLDKIELDFMPKQIPVGVKLPNSEHVTTLPLNLDCFGWISAQLALLHPKILYTPSNVCHPDTIEKSELYNDYKWLHVRQMMSSALGLGAGEYGMWSGGAQKSIMDRVFKLFDENLPGGPAEFIHLKALAFRLLFWEILENKQDLGAFADDYRHVLEAVMEWYAFPRHRIYELKGYFKGLMQL